MKKFLLLLAIVIFTFSYAHAGLKVDATCEMTNGGVGFTEFHEIADFVHKLRRLKNTRQAEAFMNKLHDEGIMGAMPPGTKVKVLEIFTPTNPISQTAKSYVKVVAPENGIEFWTFDVLLTCE